MAVPTKTVVTLSHQQLNPLDDATVMYAQVCVGSFDKLFQLLSRRIDDAYPEWNKRTDEQKKEIEEKDNNLSNLLQAVRDFVFPELVGKEAHQVRDDGVDEDARIIWDLHQVIHEHRYKRSNVLRASRTCSLALIHDERLHWFDLLQGIRGDLEGLATDNLVHYSIVAPKDVKEAAKEAAEVLTPCLTDTD